jgi:hypothetical protein
MCEQSYHGGEFAWVFGQGILFDDGHTITLFSDNGFTADQYRWIVQCSHPTTLVESEARGGGDTYVRISIPHLFTDSGVRLFFQSVIQMVREWVALPSVESDRVGVLDGLLRIGLIPVLLENLDDSSRKEFIWV